MSKLHEHPFTVILTIIAAIVAILYTVFVFFTGKPGLTDEETNKKQAKEEAQSILSKDTTKPSSLATITTDTINRNENKFTTPENMVAKPKKNNQDQNEPYSEEISYNLNEKTYWSITMPSTYFIKFYDKKGNTYKFIAYIEAVNYNGTAIQNDVTIKLKGETGNGEVSLSNNGKYLTGFLDGHTLNHQLRLND
ncbi:MAG: hypothetical protein IPP96_17115 [Chitinophagaceae bacterium]|nr:hypothetical protein [Chitinophagaceae bacterium]